MKAPWFTHLPSTLLRAAEVLARPFGYVAWSLEKLRSRIEDELSRRDAQ